MIKTDPVTEVPSDGVQQLCSLMLAHIERRGYPSVEQRPDIMAVTVPTQAAFPPDAALEKSKTPSAEQRFELDNR
jgi:hypothetical protein